MKKKRIKLVLFVAIVLFIMNLITANLKLGVYEYKPSPNSLSSTLYLMKDNRFQLNPSGIYENPTQGNYE